MPLNAKQSSFSDIVGVPYLLCCSCSKVIYLGTYTWDIHLVDKICMLLLESKCDNQTFAIQNMKSLEFWENVWVNQPLEIVIWVLS